MLLSAKLFFTIYFFKTILLGTLSEGKGLDADQNRVLLLVTVKTLPRLFV